MPPTPPPSWPAGFVRAARPEVDRLLRRARGRVLDLGDGLDHLERYVGVGTVDELLVLDSDPVRAAALERRAQSLGVPARAMGGTLDALPDALVPVDTVVSVGALVRDDDPAATLDAVRQRLAPGGRLLAFEPVPDHRRSVRRAGAGVVGTVGPVLGVGGLHLDRALPSAIRAAGFTITDLERTTMPTLLWPLRHAVALVAIPTPAIGGGR